jgi:Fe-S-cluster containining protein
MRRPSHPDPHHPTLAVETEDARRAEELTADENADLCSGCVKCCTYITVEIDPPRAAWEYDQWIWALCHRGVSLYVERPEKWFVHFETVCEHLNAAGRCAIHGRHPVLCREYDPRSCERRLPLQEVVGWFDHADDLEAWLARHRPGHYRRLLAYRRDMPQGPPVADARSGHDTEAGLVTIGDPVPPMVRSRRRSPVTRESRARRRA